MVVLEARCLSRPLSSQVEIMASEAEQREGEERQEQGRPDGQG